MKHLWIGKLQSNRRSPKEYQTILLINNKILWNCIAGVWHSANIMTLYLQSASNHKKSQFLYSNPIKCKLNSMPLKISSKPIQYSNNQKPYNHLIWSNIRITLQAIIATLLPKQKKLQFINTNKIPIKSYKIVMISPILGIIAILGSCLNSRRIMISKWVSSHPSSSKSRRKVKNRGELNDRNKNKRRKLWLKNVRKSKNRKKCRVLVLLWIMF